MYCKNCGNRLNDNDIFCTNCGTKADILNNSDNNDIFNGNNSNTNNEAFNANEKLINKNKKIFNIICKSLLVLNFLIVVSSLLEGEILTIFPSIMLIITTIGTLKTEQKKNNIFLILGIIAIFLVVLMPIIVMIDSVFVTSFIKLLGGFEDVSILDAITKTPQLLSNLKGGIFPPIELIIIGISFIIIHKKQKFKNK